MVQKHDSGGQLEFPGVPAREPRRIVLIFRAGGETHRQEFLATTELGAVLEMAREQGATSIDLEKEPNKI
jgi:hypothetical protein